MKKLIRPMLATLVSKPFNRSGWINEEKYDGFRALAYRRGNGVRLYSRNSKDITAEFPGIVRALVQLSGGDFVMDGEIVAFDRKGGPPAEIAAFPVRTKALKRSTIEVSSVNVREGDRIKSIFTEKIYEVKTIKDWIVVLQSLDGSNQIWTESGNLKLFYEKVEREEVLNMLFLRP